MAFPSLLKLRLAEHRELPLGGLVVSLLLNQTQRPMALLKLRGIGGKNLKVLNRVGHTLCVVDHSRSDHKIVL